MHHIDTGICGGPYANVKALTYSSYKFFILLFITISWTNKYSEHSFKLRIIYISGGYNDENKRRIL